jgi:hypothetical protein
MPVTRANRRLTAWIAMFAILLGALAPPIGHAVAWAGGGDMRWVEVCTAAGIELVAADANDASGGAGQGDAGVLPAGHCPYCATHAASFGLPPTPAVGLRLPAAPGPLPALHVHAPSPLFAWAVTQPRAPPARS